MTDPILPPSVSTVIRDMERRLRSLEARRSPALAQTIIDLGVIEADVATAEADIITNAADITTLQGGDDEAKVNRSGDAMTGALLADYGSAALPGLAFDGDADTGLYRHAANELGFAALGARVLALSANWATFGTGATGEALINVHHGGSSAGNPAFTFSGDGNTGMYHDGLESIGFSTNGVERMQIGTTNVNFAAAVTGAASIKADGAGTAADPAFQFVGDPNTGMYRAAADQVALSAGGTARLTVTTSAIVSAEPWSGPAGTAALPAITTTGDLNTGIYFPSADEIAISAGGGYIALFRDDAQTVFRHPPNQDTSSGDGSDAFLFDSYDTSSGKGRFAGIAFRGRYGTDRHVVARLWQPGGDRLGFRNWENTLWTALDASAFTVSSSKREKKRIRTARTERGLLDFAVPGERELAFSQYEKLRPVLFDNQEQHFDRKWIPEQCPAHDSREECEAAECENAEPTCHLHHCDDLDCPGTSAHPCWDIEQHVDRVGLIAEEVAEIYPKAVPRTVGLVSDHEGEDAWQAGGVMGIDTHMLHVETINVVQYLIEEVRELRAELDNIKKTPRTPKPRKGPRS